LSVIAWFPSAHAAPEHELEAQDVTASTDSVNEVSYIEWKNIQTSDFNVLTAMIDSHYQIWRADRPFESNFTEYATLIGNEDVCDSHIPTIDCSGERAKGSHNFSFGLPVDVSGTFYYMVSTVLNGSTPIFHLTETTKSQGINETSQPIKTPYLLTASFNGFTSSTTLQWVNANDIEPRFNETGNESYNIIIYEHTWRATAAKWADLGNVRTEIANLSAIDENGSRINSYVVSIPPNSNREMYYTVTYRFPGYEDTRFKSSNTLVDPLLEDNAPPGEVQLGDVRYFSFGNATGGYTHIPWACPLEGGMKVPYTYHIWRSSQEFTRTDEFGVELVTTVESSCDTDSIQAIIPIGVMRDAYYAITAQDSAGNERLVVTNGVSRKAVSEDTISDYKAFPTDISASFNGPTGQTTITWNDAKHVSGESYTIWRSRPVKVDDLSYNPDIGVHLPITGSSIPCDLGQIDFCTVERIATNVSEGSGTYTIQVEDDVSQTVYYAVTTEYKQWLNQSEPKEDLEYIAGTNALLVGVAEDTLAPYPVKYNPDNTVVDGVQAKATIVWDDDTSNGMNNKYLIYRWTGPNDPFFDTQTNVSVSNTTLDAQPGWTLVYGPFGRSTAGVGTVRQQIEIEHGVERESYYAIIVQDEYGNIQLDLNLHGGAISCATLGCNAFEIREDTLAPLSTVVIRKDSSTPPTKYLKPGSPYEIVIEVSEELADRYEPLVNVSTTTGQYLLPEEKEYAKKKTEFVYTTTLVIPEGLSLADVNLTVELEDIAGNSVIHAFDGWSLDAVMPSVELYSPSEQTRYLWGEDLVALGAARDDNNVTRVEFNIDDLGFAQVTELTYRQAGVEKIPYVAFRIDIPASNFEPGQHTIKFRVTDAGGNQVITRSYSFLVDWCDRDELGLTRCQTEIDTGPPEPEAQLSYKPVLGDANYVVAFASMAMNVFLIILALMVILSATSDPRKKKRRRGDDDDDEMDDWMSNFMGVSATSEDDLRSNIDSNVDTSGDSKPQQKSLDSSDEEDDELTPDRPTRKRRRKKVVLDEDDDDDDDEPVIRRRGARRKSVNLDEDDDDDQPRRKPAKRR